MNKEEYKTGLWKTESKKGTTYYSGKIKIGSIDYNIALFKNQKQNDKQPDLNIIIRNKIEKKEDNTQVYADFGELTEVEDIELGF